MYVSFRAGTTKNDPWSDRPVAFAVALPCHCFFSAPRKTEIALTGNGQGIPQALTLPCQSAKKTRARLPGNCSVQRQFAAMDTFERVIGEDLAPYLRTVGFLRDGQTWNRRTEGVVQVISVQRSMNNTELNSRFTINVGVTPDTRPANTRLAEHECRSRLRIGFLRAERQDHWYRYRPRDPASVRRAVAEARADVEAYVMPYLSQKPGDFSPLLLQATSAMQTHVRAWKAFDSLCQRIVRLWPFKTTSGR
ncbi:DUF4304 domain-containing protein [Sinorhizobium americanum]|uniref:DUF4304 domain-containing protein n=1 Tax=Sinorhizobium americanum TaxID=194963 RepID=UPI001FD903B6|nr:DUF4304 domain-containing protein [Sinorhizobium americanum]